MTITFWGNAQNNWEKIPLKNGDGSPLYDYATVLARSILFYDANHCGPDVTETNRFSWRGDCHIHDGLEWTFENGETRWVDTTGGYHDAGDHIKFGITNAYAASCLGWGFLEFRSAFEETGQDVWILRAIKRATDFFIKNHIEPEVFIYGVGSSEDHNFWGPPELQSDITSPRDIQMATPNEAASDICGNTAAALALMAINYRHIDQAYADECLAHARDIYSLGRKYLGLGNGLSFYPPSIYWDDLAWGAICLYAATKENYYLDQFNEIIGPDCAGLDKDTNRDNGIDWNNQWTQCWDAVWAGAFGMAARTTEKPVFIAQVKSNLDFWLYNLAESPGGLKYLTEWGSLRYSSAAALTSLAFYNAFPTKENEKYRDFGASQINYALGSNPINRCYVVGINENSAIHPHHDAAHGSDTGFLDDPPFHKHVLYGALVGGPGINDQHHDLIDDFVQNEVSIDYNACFVGALAGMRHFFGRAQMPEPDPEPEPPAEEIFVEATIKKDTSERTQVTFYIHNHSTHPPHFETQLSYRYFVDLSEVFEQGYNMSNLKVETVVNEKSSAVLDPEFQPWDELHHIYYLEISYPDVLLYNKREFQLGIIFITPNYKGQWDSSNDFSRQGLGETPVKALSVPVYRAGKLIWGKEPYKDTIPPLAPQNLTASASGSFQINLNWDQNKESDFDHYNIYAARTPDFSTSINTFAGKSVSSSFSHTGLDKQTEYYYQVTAVDTSLNESLPSKIISAITGIPDKDPPEAPQALSISAVTHNSITLLWLPNSENDIAIYNIYRSDKNSFLPNPENLAGQSLKAPFVDQGLKANTEYFYIISAFDTSGNEGALSSMASATTLMPPPAKIRLKYKCMATENTSIESRFNLNLINEGTETLDLSQITARYWLSYPGDLSNLTARCDYSDSNQQGFTFHFGEENSMTFLEIGFNSMINIPTWLGGSGSPLTMPAGAQLGECQIRFYETARNPQNQSDDYSFGPLQKESADWEKICLYNQGVLAWGQAPSQADTFGPLLSHPADINLQNSNGQLVWSAFDNYPDNYSIICSKDGQSEECAFGQWNNDFPITLDLLSFNTGEYIFSIVVKDQSGNSSDDEVEVKIGNTSSTGIKGDVNNSGKIDIVDALLTAQYYVGLIPSEFILSRADVNCSETVNIVDAMLMAQFYVKIIQVFPCQ
ncbi:MAG: glycoside hydrolase family 9 protein [Spirochaetales bacterium]|nr:glycoside hydrolase family 9 protein [Spirochaetales bacterium]